MSPNRRTLSLVVPCYNEEASLPRLSEQLTQELEQLVETDWEVILIDDGSYDQTSEIIRELNKADARFKGVFLSRNFGHQMALSTGLHLATGDAVGIIDCDLQDPIHVLMELYQRVRYGECDVAYGIRQNREAPVFLNICYKAFYWLLSKTSDIRIPRDSGDFCVLSRKAHRLILSLPENQRFIRGLRAWIGLKQIGVSYNRPERRDGTSKYNFWKLLLLAVNGITAFSVLPLRFASLLGFLSCFLTLILAVFLLINRFVPTIFPFGYYVGVSPGTTSIILLILGGFSGVFLCLGILGEYLAILVKEVKARPTAIVEDLVGIKLEGGYQSLPAIPSKG